MENKICRDYNKPRGCRYGNDGDVIKLDTIIEGGGEINWDKTNIDFLSRAPYFLETDEVIWMISKLKHTDFSSMNIHDTIMTYKSQMLRVMPARIEKSFCLLDLTTQSHNDILKIFIEKGCVYIDNNNTICKPTETIIEFGDSRPTITEIFFDMPYCLSCMKNQSNYTIKFKNHTLKKIFNPVEQPFFCNNCFEFLQKIINNKTIETDSIKLFVGSKIIDLCLIREKFSIILLGFKYDDNSIMGQNDMVLDIFKYIVFLYMKSINL